MPLLWYIGLVLMQALVFNHIHLLGYATPMPYVYLLLILPHPTARWSYVLWGFALGILVDLFTAVPGPAAAATTLTGLLAPLALRATVPADKMSDGFQPSTRSLKWMPFLRYALLVVLAHHVAYFLLESFSLFNLPTLLIHIGTSTLLTLLIIAGIERVKRS